MAQNNETGPVFSASGIRLWFAVFFCSHGNKLWPFSVCDTVLLHLLPVLICTLLWSSADIQAHPSRLISLVSTATVPPPSDWLQLDFEVIPDCPCLQNGFLCCKSNLFVYLASLPTAPATVINFYSLNASRAFCGTFFFLF